MTSERCAFQAPELRLLPPGFWLICLLYAVCGIVFRFLTPPHADAIHIAHSTRRLLDGSLAIYSERHHEWAAPPLGLAVGYPPLYAIVLAPFVALANVMGGSDSLAARLTAVPEAIFDVLAVWQCCIFVQERVPGMSGRTLTLTAGAFFLTSGMIAATWHTGHPESMIVFFVVLAWRMLPTSKPMSGVLMGLSFLSKQTAILALIPLWASLRDERHTLRVVLVAFIVTIGLVFLPFALTHPDQTFYALVVAETRREIGGVNVWRGVSFVAHRLLGDSEAYAQLRAAVIRYANLSVIFATAAICFFSVRGNTFPVRRTLAAMSASTASMLVLGKWVDAHYFVLPMCLLLMYDCERRNGGFPIIAAGIGLLVQSAYSLGKTPLIGIQSTMIFAASTFALLTALSGLMSRAPQRA